jgi:uncharacterized paraquat-inducible protein A
LCRSIACDISTPPEQNGVTPRCFHDIVQKRRNTMINNRFIALAAFVMAGAATLSSAEARNAVRSYGGVGQHATVMNNIYQAQQQNNAAISHVQNNIRSTQPKAY